LCGRLIDLNETLPVLSSEQPEANLSKLKFNLTFLLPLLIFEFLTTRAMSVLLKGGAGTEASADPFVLIKLSADYTSAKLALVLLFTKTCIA